jgi:hypothetical protein
LHQKRQDNFISNRRDIQFTFNPHNKATVLDCSFIVDSTNGNGFGIRSLKKSGRISSVFMHTTVTPGTAANGLVNPNPESGIIVVNLQDNYNTYLGGYSGFASPLSGSNISISGSSVLTVGAPYVIVSLGTSTQANWVAAGLSPAIKAAVGVSFIAKITGGGTGTGIVQAPAATGAGIDHMEVIGDANLMNNLTGYTVAGNPTSGVGSGIGMELILACFKNTALTAPTDNTVIGMNFYMNNSAQGV